MFPNNTRSTPAEPRHTARSAADLVRDGTFQMLDHLPEDVRQLCIEKLAKKELVAIVAAVW